MRLWAAASAAVLLCAADALFLQDPLKLAELPAHPRSKRQAYPVEKSGSQDEILGIRTTVEESGAWGPWALDKDCSRTCGGGVQHETRQCSGECSGPSKRYISCATEPCPEDAGDFREEQCAKYNDKDFEGAYYKWKPATASNLKNRCELNCQPETGGFFMKFAERVEDGTSCDAVSTDICVEGFCTPLGCDGQLGSTEQDDKCLVCGGTGQDCKTVAGLFDERGLELSAYHDVITLPKGAMSIRVEEKRPTNNYLALRNSTGDYVLNANHRIELPGAVKAGGVNWDYQRTKASGVAFEMLKARGPLKEEVTVALLYQSDGSTGIDYEYSMALETAKYVYKPAEWSPCSVTCGKGEQTRELDCFDTEANAVVEASLCEEANASAPETTMECETADCDAEWFAGDWEECSETCGEGGWQYRVVYCHQVFKDGSKITVDDETCGEGRPEPSQACNRFSCPEWNAGPWSACSKPCGDAKQYRSVACRSEKEGEEGKLMASTACSQEDGTRPENQRPCNLGPCTGLDFVIGEWELCSKCNDTTESRSVKCTDEAGKQYPLDKCEGDAPEDTRPCNVTVECTYLWHTSAWSDCSTDCGRGHKTREVYCAISTGGQLMQMDDMHCTGERPEAKTNCTQETECTGTYMTTEWSECTASCAGGTQTRKAHCFTWDYQKDESLCDPATMPNVTQDCNTQPCPTCSDGEFGCCPDNSTYAEGPFLQGCSNCSDSEFGCCADNMTAAAGEDFKGCPGVEVLAMDDVEGSGESSSEDSSKDSSDSSSGGSSGGSSGMSESMEERPECAESEHGCCPDGLTLATGPENEGCPELLCQYKNEEDGVEITIPCVNETADATLDGDNATASNETMDAGENVTKTCKDSEFGCCGDWVTEAEGEDFAGCPTFELGVCDDNATAPFGCCPDNVTQARGAEDEGCGAADCAASTFGCCGDRVTIAFGPHYEGCERSNFPCEASEFGCCPDGETAALGTAGEGCGESCLLTKFGCCPDGVKAAEGDKNEGCGCSVAPYGCCPDGETTAEGPNFAGCPSTCATSSFGCCPDGKTAARGPSNAGCPCQYTQFGCCEDGETAARGPNREGCDDCRYAKHGCCADGKTIARGPNSLGCPPPPTRAPAVAGGTASPTAIAGCAEPKAEGRPCGQYTVQWYFDADKAVCDRFWYGGCDGNNNRFASEAECKGVCVEPPGTGRCYLPKSEGRKDCADYQLSWAYDPAKGACGAFYWRGCDGNANRFETQARCERFCFGVGDFQRPRPQPPQPPRAQPQPQPQQPRQPQPEPVPLPTRDPRTRTGLSRWDAGRPAAPPSASPSQDSSGWASRAPVGAETGVRDFAAAQRARQIAERQRAAAAAAQQRPRPGHHGHASSGQLSEVECRAPSDAGPCRAYIQSFYFDSGSGHCTTFIYGGCGGNANRFDSSEECQRQCGRYGSRHIPQARVLPTAAERSKGRCEKQMDPGACQGAFPRYYYEPALGQCLVFDYSGCGGNDNRFDSETECERTCQAQPTLAAIRQTQERPTLTAMDPDCLLPAETGHSCPAASAATAYHYSPVEGTCVKFTFAGCGGNGNRFEREAECQSRCARHAFPCELPKVTGPCRASKPRWFFNYEAGRCQEFVFGGCLGNTNNFKSQGECEERCITTSEEAAVLGDVVVEADAASDGPESANLLALADEADRPTQRGSLERDGGGGERRRGGEVAPSVPVPLPPSHHPHARPESELPELCSLALEAGGCFGSEAAWGWDWEAGACRGFLYTGCDGNANRFASEEACERACGSYRDQDVCSLAPAEGSCEASVPKWAFVDGACAPLLYSGCGGNGNRFSSAEECADLCKKESRDPIEVCRQPALKGPCEALMERWWHNPESGQCESFEYGGCDGNENNFATERDCERRCGASEVVGDDVCLLERDAGPCTDPVSAWFYSAADGDCRLFTYGGCRGNANRFQSKEDCLARCRGRRVARIGHKAPEMEKEAVVSTTEASVKGASSGWVLTVKADAKELALGEAGILSCWAEGNEALRGFRWRKDGRKVHPSPHLKLRQSGRFLKIVAMRAEDAGDYVCEHRRDGSLSRPLTLSLRPAEATSAKEACVDDPAKADCRRIVGQGLCTHRWYAKPCCASCARWKQQLRLRGRRF